MRRYGGAQVLEPDQLASAWPHRSGLVTFGHMQYRQLVDQGLVDAEFDRRAFKFAVCRNPYDRAISLYAYLQRVGPVPVDVDFDEFLRRLVADGCPPVGLYNVAGWSQCNPQVEWLRGVGVDRVVRFENLDEELPPVSRTIGIVGAPLGRRNVTERPRSDREYLDEKNVERIEAIYAADFTAFGYAKISDVGFDTAYRQRPRRG